MASKSKNKLKKKEFEVHGRSIRGECFAFDIFVHSAKKFGVPDECICSWEAEKNDYLYHDFIVVISRILFKYQIMNRFQLYESFKKHCESKNLENFQTIHDILQNVLTSSVRDMGEDVIPYLQEAVISLSVINELIVFLYSQNCDLYLKKLAKFWFQYWNPKIKYFEKAGGLAQIYARGSQKKHYNWDVFFDQFIPEFCIPYESTCVSTLKKTYYKKYQNFFNNIVRNLPEKDRRQIIDTMMKRRHAIASEPRERVILPPKTSERSDASGTNIPINTGLGIQTHEEVLRNIGIFPAGTATSPQDPPSISHPEPSKNRRGLSSQKERQKKTLSSRSSLEDVERLNTGLLGADAATPPDNLPSTSLQRTERRYKESSSAKAGQKDKSSSRSILDEDLQRLNLGSDKKNLGRE